MTTDNINKNTGSTKFIGIIIIILFIIAGIYFVFFKEKRTNMVEQTITKEISKEKEIVVKESPVINYNELEKDDTLKKAMEKRKNKYDIKNSLDMIVNSDETFKIKDKMVSMAKILKLAALKRGDVVEEDIAGKTSGKGIKQYGIYVVKPGDNIWNIHFNILREYYNLKNINLNLKADEPDKKGFSSGIGKILKFSEKIVTIYNLEQGTIDSDINIIKPFTKIIVYNMTDIFSLLNDINYKNVSNLKFDGKTIWIATDKKTNTQ